MKRRMLAVMLVLLGTGLALSLVYRQKRLELGKTSAAEALASSTAPIVPAAPTLPRTSVSSPIAASSCPRFDKGREVGRVKNADLVEASGLAVSRQNPGVIWSHNDTNRHPRLFAMLLDGTDLGTYTLDDVEPVDWEDMAIAKSTRGSGWDLYVGDIGNNSTSRPEITLYRVREPKVQRDQKPKNRRLRHVERFSLAYPKHESHDAETLIVDPISNDVYLVTKGRTENATLYRAKAPLVAGDTALLEELTAPNGINGAPRHDSLATGGDISDDGGMVVVRTYKDAFLWQRKNGESLSMSLERIPCPLKLRREEQGESIAFTTDGSGYLTLSEGERPRIYFFERKKDE